MRSASLLRSAAFLAVLMTTAAVLAFGANAVLRPGCSLLPVSLPAEEFAAQPATLEQACAVLGRPLPQPVTLPPGARMEQLGIDGPPPANLTCCRMVHVSYSMNGKNFALLDIHKQDAIPAGNLAQINAALAGVPAVIQQSRRQTLDSDDVAYLWARDGLLYGLHVLLTDGVTRDLADAMAASIR